MTIIQPGSLKKPEDAARTPEQARVAFWLAQREMADEEEKGWRENAEKAVKRFRDEEAVSKGSIAARKAGTKFNILRANVRVLGGAIYQSQPKPDIRRRFAAKDPVGKAVSEVLERSCTYMMDEYDFHGSMKLAVHSMLVPGRGVTRVRYEPEIIEQDDAGESGDDSEDMPQEAVAWQKVRCEHVQWRDFRRGAGRTWDEVTWISFDHYLTADQVKTSFPGIDIDLLEPVECENNFSDEKKKDGAVQDALRRYHVIEVWDKTERQIWWISKGYEKPLKVEEDPLELKDFWPIPRPLYALDQDDTLVPVEDFRAYADQADELDKITGRISRIISAIKVRGIYDSTLTVLADLLKSGGDNEMLPAQNSTPVMQAGGFDKAIWLLPVETLAKVLESLYTQRDQIKQTIYEITGISDIFRGSTDPNETLGAQQLKAQNGSVSISDRQDNVARYARDLVRIMAEIVSQEFEPQVLQAMTGVELPSAQEKQAAQAQMQSPPMDENGQPAEPDPEAVEYLQKPSWDEVMQILKSDQMRSYRVGIETDSTIAGDAQKDQQNVTDLLEAAGGYVTAILPAVESGLIEIDGAKALLMSVLRRFRLGREVEDAMDAVSESMGKGQGGMSPQQAQQMQAQMQDQGQQMQQAAQEIQAKEQELAQREKAVQQAEAQLQKDVKAAQQVLDAESRAKQAESLAAVKDAQLQGATQAANAKQPAMHYGADGAVQQIVDHGDSIAQVAQMIAQLTQAIQVQAQAQAESTMKIQQQMQQLMQIMLMDNEAVRGPNGELIGSRKVLQ